MKLGDDPGEESEDEYDMGPTPSGLQASQHAHTVPNAPAPSQKTKTTWTRIWDVEEVFEIMNSGLTILKQSHQGKKERATTMRTVAALYEAIKKELCNHYGGLGEQKGQNSILR